MRVLLATVLACILLRSPASAAPPRPSEPILSFSRIVRGVRVQYVAVNLADPRIRVRVELCHGFPGGAEPFEAMIRRLNPVAAIGGSYFSQRTKLPIGDIVREGRQVYHGMMRTALTLSPQGAPAIRRVPRGHAADWRGCQTVLVCGPALVVGGRVAVAPEREGFHDRHIMADAPRLAVGYTADRHLLLAFIAGDVSFAEEGRLMRALGCIGAMNLDAGPGRALYCRGCYLARPERRMTNILCVYRQR